MDERCILFSPASFALETATIFVFTLSTYTHTADPAPLDRLDFHLQGDRGAKTPLL